MKKCTHFSTAAKLLKSAGKVQVKGIPRFCHRTVGFQEWPQKSKLPKDLAYPWSVAFVSYRGVELYHL